MSVIATHREPIRVLVVDDSAFMRAALSRMIASAPDFEVAGTASNSSEALSKVSTLNPDVITLDVEMPGRRGIETLRDIMSEFPRPVIMVSSVTEKNAQLTFDALAAGAFDYIPKQLSSNSLDILHIREDLIAKVRAAALSRRLAKSSTVSRKPPQSTSLEKRETLVPASAIVAVGISTGGPKALQEILPLLPRDLAVPILIVQHMPLKFTGPFAQRLNSLCSVAVLEATQNEPIQAGVVYIAPAGMHMRVERHSDARAFIRLDTQPGNYLHVPSADVLMKSVAEAYRGLAMGVIMTGMGSDGAQGIKTIQTYGGFTLGQDQASCTVYGMPRVCAELGVLDRVVPLSQIPAQILQATHHRKRA
jgi:two-component system, chemotaxis family, protein-glutamate methylesterase/glutaminase